MICPLAGQRLHFESTGKVARLLTGKVQVLIPAKPRQHGCQRGFAMSGNRKKETRHCDSGSCAWLAGIAGEVAERNSLIAMSEALQQIDGSRTEGV